MLWPLIRRNTGLTSVDIDGVSDKLDLRGLALTLQTLPGLIRLRLECSFQYYNTSVSDRLNKVNPEALGWLIRALAYPHLRLKSLILHVRVESGLPPEWNLFEADQDHDQNPKNRTAQFPELEEFAIHDSGHNSHWIAEAILLPMLREAPVLKKLSIPYMSMSTSKAIVKVLEERQLPLEDLLFDSPGCDAWFVDMVKIHRRTLRTLEAYHNHPSYEMRDDTYCEPMLQALVPTSMTTSDLSLQMVNLQVINMALVASPTVSTLIQRILTSLPNLRYFTQDFVGKPPPFDEVYGPHGKLEIRDLVASPWVCSGLELLCVSLGSRSVEDGVDETLQERRDKIRRVYKQLGALTQLKELTLACDVLNEQLSSSSEVAELDFTFETGLQEMEPCLKHLVGLYINRVQGVRFGEPERQWVKERALRLVYLEDQPQEEVDDLDDDTGASDEE
ncbi:hypothetical protein BGZ74_008316 [Mortierella antarctica]|nr:hypothetical protein BGZ74_008316 [Mortierella antarctica]